MNKVIMMGRLTRDPEVRYSQGANATAVARYSIAVDRRFRRDGEPEADFFNCTVFGRGAEFAEKYLKQGTKIVITGRVENDNYTNKDGQKVYGTRILVEEQEFAESKNASAGNSGNSFGGNSFGNSNSAPSASSAGEGFMNIPDGVDEELPFN
ncbi:MAG: single-stranded DNA-binding protein [Lachnospiraceae bacterium]|nr:single-stranded DNA-binding protein [Lachnospiraceae bacterium]